MTTDADPQRAGFEASLRAWPDCLACSWLACRDGDPHHCMLYKAFLRPCPRELRRYVQETRVSETLEDLR